MADLFAPAGGFEPPFTLNKRSFVLKLIQARVLSTAENVFVENLRHRTFVVPLGFEPRAAGLENLCSIQLSYGTI